MIDKRQKFKTTKGKGLGLFGEGITRNYGATIKLYRKEPDSINTWRFEWLIFEVAKTFEFGFSFNFKLTFLSGCCIQLLIPYIRVHITLFRMPLKSTKWAERNLYLRSSLEKLQEKQQKHFDEELSKAIDQ